MLTDTEARIWTIQQREAIVERLRALADHADEELFVVLTSDGLLTADCLVHLRDATERGVTVTIGSPSRTVRKRLQQAVPDALVWEPRQTWLDPTATGNGRLSRLVIADRQAAMLATLGGEIDGERTETALTGDGQDNGLVVVIQNLVEAQLDQFTNTHSRFQSPASP